MRGWSGKEGAARLSGGCRACAVFWLNEVARGDTPWRSLRLPWVCWRSWCRCCLAPAGSPVERHSALPAASGATRRCKPRSSVPWPPCGRTISRGATPSCTLAEPTPACGCATRSGLFSPPATCIWPVAPCGILPCANKQMVRFRPSSSTSCGNRSIAPTSRRSFTSSGRSGRRATTAGCRLALPWRERWPTCGSRAAAAGT